MALFGLSLFPAASLRDWENCAEFDPTPTSIWSDHLLFILPLLAIQRSPNLLQRARSMICSLKARKDFLLWSQWWLQQNFWQIGYFAHCTLHKREALKWNTFDKTVVWTFIVKKSILTNFWQKRVLCKTFEKQRNLLTALCTKRSSEMKYSLCLWVAVPRQMILREYLFQCENSVQCAETFLKQRKSFTK